MSGFKCLLVDDPSLLNPKTGKTTSVRTFCGTTVLAFGNKLFENLESDPAALQVLVHLTRVTQMCGSPESSNWVYAPRRDIAKKTHQSFRTITRAVERLMARGYVIRNEHNLSVYRIPSKFFLTGNLEAVPEPPKQNDSPEFQVLVAPEEIYSEVVTPRRSHVRPKSRPKPKLKSLSRMA